MSSISTTSVNLAQVSKRDVRRVAVATVIGTTVEWYDFFLYATAAGLVFQGAFFAPAGPQVGQLLSFATIGISFLFRPLGAFLAGHFGDRIGRRPMLVLTLIGMGICTALIGCLPSYATIGVAAPILLIVLRILQGLSVGGEWGGAALMAVEFAKPERRGRFGSIPQLGVPIGLLLSNGVLALMTSWISPGDAFVQWGWRIPFLLSVVLIVVGYFVRRSVDESPVFREIQKEEKREKAPIIQVVKKHWLLVILAAFTFVGNNGPGYLTTGGYIQNYATTPLSAGGHVGLDRTPVLLAVVVSAVVWLVVAFLAGALSDRIGRRPVYLIGFVLTAITVFVLFPMVNTAEIGVLMLGICIFSVGLGFTYGPQPAFFAELFPATVRYTGISIAYAIGAILGGAFAPLISAALVEKTGTTVSVSVYIAGLAVLGLLATLWLKERKGIDLSPANLAEQEKSAIRGIG